MKICILTKFYPPRNTEGIPRTRELYAKGFAAKGHEVHVITSGHHGAVYEQDGVIVHEIPNDRPDEIGAHFRGFSAGEHFNYVLSYSYRVADKVAELHQFHRFDLIDSPLWDIEGYITKLKIPSLKMVVRLETTSRQVRDINTGSAGEMTVGDKYERNFMKLADGLVFDSWCILEEVSKYYHIDFADQSYEVVHHGIDEKLPCGGSEHKAADPNSENLNILYVGRLEKRKGINFLLKNVVPRILKETENVVFHLVGKDCSDVDGFFREENCTYSEFCQRELGSGVSQRVIFYGYVEDKKLKEIYDSSDLLVNFSRYESFGLLYLEAMRASKAQMVFKIGAIEEIMYGNEGVFIFEEDDADAVVEAILQVENNKSKLALMGKQSRRHFEKWFTADRMVNQCESYFERLLSDRKPRVFHMMYALDLHDGVSEIAVDYYNLTQELGFESHIIGRYCHPELQHMQLPLEDCIFTENDILLVHYWAFSEFVPRFKEINCRKILIFHNVTHPHFFSVDQPEWGGTARAYAQMSELCVFDEVATFSKFSQFPLKAYFGETRDFHVLPPLLDAQELRSRSFDKILLDQLESETRKKLLFVGRIVSHKKQHQLVELLNVMAQEEQLDAVLYLVGKINDSYLPIVQKTISRYHLEKRVIITGEVSDAQMYGYYRGCDAFVSMSEHEGFCLPLIYAMVFGLPVFAYAQPAVAETIGSERNLFAEKSFPSIAKLICQNLSDDKALEEIEGLQNQRLKTFQKENVKAELLKLITKKAVNE